MDAKFKIIRNGFGTHRKYYFINRETNEYIYVFRTRGDWNVSAKLGTEITKDDILEIQQALEQDTNDITGKDSDKPDGHNAK